MATVEFPISVNYCESWKGIWPPAREFVQNALDAVEEFGGTQSITWTPGKGGTLNVINEGSTMTLRALLLGESTKRNNDNCRGKHGEGLKIGSLAALRDKRTVKILNGSDTWTPMLKESETFGTTILVFNITRKPGATSQDRVHVKMWPVTEAEWVEIRSKVRCLSDDKPEDVIVTSRGSLLKAPERKGQIFAKGLWVETDAELGYGYDLDSADLDRDRRIVSRWDLKYGTRTIWEEAATRDKATLDTLFEGIEANRSDFEDFETTYNDTNLAAQIATLFHAKYGERSVAVSTMAQSRELGHLGATGVVVPTALVRLTERAGFGVNTVKAKYATETEKLWSWHELTEDEQSNLDTALLMLHEVTAVDISIVDVVAFRSDSLKGLWNGTTKRISIARSTLSDAVGTLSILVHESAHMLSGASDGENGHVAEIERLWAAITRAIWTR